MSLPVRRDVERPALVAGAHAVVRDAGLVLRAEGAHGCDVGRLPWRSLLGWVTVAGFGYGAAMGSSRGVGAQALYSALKVPLLLGLASALALPNFFVVNTLLGLREDFPRACRGLLAAQASLTLLLLGQAPLILLLYVSGIGYGAATLSNGVAFLFASLGAHTTLRRHYAPLLARDRRHRLGLRAWFALHTLIAIQLAWVLRPFIGWEGLPPTFLRANAFEGSAYESVFGILRRMATGG